MIATVRVRGVIMRAYWSRGGVPMSNSGTHITLPRERPHSACPMAELVTASDCYCDRKVLSSSLSGAVRLYFTSKYRSKLYSERQRNDET